jgi:hypothetical protein
VTTYVHLTRHTYIYERRHCRQENVAQTRRSQYHTKPTIYESFFLLFTLFVGRIADCSDAPALLKSSYHMPAVALSVYTSPGLFSSAENCVSHGNTTLLWSHVRCRTQHHASCQLYYRLPCARRQQIPFFTRWKRHHQETRKIKVTAHVRSIFSPYFLLSISKIGRTTQSTVFFLIKKSTSANFE